MFNSLQKFFLYVQVEKFVISPELLIYCECAFSFWSLLLYPKSIIFDFLLLLFSYFFPDFACPCILTDWRLPFQVLVWQTSCNDRALLHYFVTLFCLNSLYSCCRNKYYCWYCWNAYRLIFSFLHLSGSIQWHKAYSNGSLSISQIAVVPETSGV